VGLAAVRETCLARAVSSVRESMVVAWNMAQPRVFETLIAVGTVFRERVTRLGKLISVSAG